MSKLRVLVLYDFNGQETGDLTVEADEEVWVEAWDGGDWVTAINSKGVVGIVPANFLQIPSYQEFLQQSSTEPNKRTESASSQRHHSDNLAVPKSYGNDSDFDSDIDDTSSIHTTKSVSSTKDQAGGFGFFKSVNKMFATVTNSSCQNYVSGELVVSKQPSKFFNIDMTQDGAFWLRDFEEYSVKLSLGQKGSKFGGMKTFISYDILPSFSNKTVSRRFKQFDWLTERLHNAFPVCIIPCLPDKQVTGRYEDEFLKRRLARLQLYVNRISIHPVLCEASVIKHFFKSDADEAKWKNGKREAEKSEFNRGGFFYTVNKPIYAVEKMEVEKTLNQFLDYSSESAENSKSIYLSANEFIKSHHTSIKPMFSKFGEKLDSYAQGINKDRAMLTNSLIYVDPQLLQVEECLKHTAKTFTAIGNEFEKSANEEMLNFEDALWESSGLIAQIPEIIKTQQGCSDIANDLKDQFTHGKVDEETYLTSAEKSDNVSFAVMAEINNYQVSKSYDIRNSMINFLKSQVQLYSNITDMLTKTLDEYQK